MRSERIQMIVGKHFLTFALLSIGINIDFIQSGSYLLVHLKTARFLYDVLYWKNRQFSQSLQKVSSPCTDTLSASNRVVNDFCSIFESGSPIENSIQHCCRNVGKKMLHWNRCISNDFSRSELTCFYSSTFSNIFFAVSPPCTLRFNKSTSPVW